ncbi:MAG: hypothetical protein DRQ49_02365 [Gammaproteobacteria bacterium]|nr:MAG: hypothetical protein DRQ41_08835 [Gammaproteobacteria bacterium]RKZ42311.1 MAG: hypothetical protein DRQ49_02365 [Gammaproteobacteria bacterium]RKZ73308.1 MAG: hypothetical protein DRQ57_14825 [Gammaproteobacteria bacterium]
MRYSILQMAVILILYLFALQTGYALSIDIVDKLDIKAIKSIKIKQNENNFRAEVIVQFSTSAKTALKFKNANFDLTFKDGNGKEIYLGNTQPAEILFPASQEGSEKFTEEMLDVNVGKNEAQTIARLLLMFNLIGNPDSEFEMILSGTTEIGIKAKRGWLYQGEVKIENFIFYPTIQREVLFK